MIGRWTILWALAWGVSVFPLSAQEAAPETDPTYRLRPVVRVLLEDLHNQSRADDQGSFGQGSLKRILEASGAAVESTLDVMSADPSLPGKLTPEYLSHYELVISNGQNLGRPFRPMGGSGPPPVILNAFLKDEISALQTFVERGGILFVSSDSGALSLGNAPRLYNPMLKDFGVQVVFDPARGAPSSEAPLAHGADHPLVTGLTRLVPTLPARLMVTNKDAKTLFELSGRPMVAVIPRGKGWLVAAGGGSSWMNYGLQSYPAEPKAPNVRFIQNLMKWTSDLLEVRSATAPAASPPLEK